MKRIVLVLLVCVAAGMVSAETIKGSVIDANGEAMPFVTISVLAPDSSLLTGTITNDDGSYEIELSAVSSQLSEYIIQASYVGYQTVYKEARGEGREARVRR